MPKPKPTPQAWQINVLDIFKDKTADFDVRFGAAQALANLGEVAKPLIKDTKYLPKPGNRVEILHSYGKT